MSELMKQTTPNTQSEMEFSQFISILEMRIRLSGGGHQMSLAIDRISCPIPSEDNKSAILIKSAAKEIIEWSKVLPPAEQKILNSIMSSHIKNSVHYLKEAQQAGEAVNG